MRTRSALFCAFLLLGWCRPAPSQSTARYTLKGSVVNSLTGEPIRKALIEIPGSEAHAAFTGSDGRFEIEGVPAGNYTVVARRPGFQDPRQSNAPMSRPSNQTLVLVGPDTPDVLIKLSPLGALAGHIADPDGRPIPNLQVQSLQLMIVSGRRHWMPVGSAQTDDDGHFRIENLAPGTYILQTQQQLVYPGPVANDEATRLFYPRMYFANSPELTGAQSVEVKPGGTAEADLSVTALRGTRVYFSVNPRLPYLQASLSNDVGEEIPTDFQPVHRGKEWVLASVAPGTWNLTVSSNGPNGELFGQVPIEVGATDVRNIVVPVAPMLQIPVVISGSTPPESEAVQRSGDTIPLTPSGPSANVQLTSVPDARQGGSYGSQPAQGGVLSISNVRPGNYRASVTSWGQQCVDTVTSGSTDLTHNDLTVTFGSQPAPINVTLRNDCASLDITAKQEQPEPVSIVVFPDAHTSEPLVFQSGEGGKVTIPALSPGEYQVFAFSDLTAVEYANPDVLRKYNGTTVSLAPNGTAALSVEVNASGAAQ